MKRNRKARSNSEESTLLRNLVPRDSANEEPDELLSVENNTNLNWHTGLTNGAKMQKLEDGSVRVFLEADQTISVGRAGS